MYISVTRIAGAPPQAVDRMVEGFRQGARDLTKFDGFLGFEIWRNEEGLEAVSKGVSKAAMEGYTNSADFGAHHGSGAARPGSSVAYYDAEVLA